MKTILLDLPERLKISEQYKYLDGQKIKNLIKICNNKVKKKLNIN